MPNDFIQNELEFLLSSAMKKCDSIADAEDITQETVLAGLIFIKNGGIMDDPRSWLLTVLNRKYYDLLRRKYRLPTVAMGADHEIACEEDIERGLICKEEAEAVRREVAYLAQSYRNVIVKHYFYKKSIKDIANELGLPEGTVKSRLDFGRKQLKKGFDSMEKYTDNSYMPQFLRVGISGSLGLGGDPQFLVEGDMLAQNLLILAYEKPITVTELSKAIGVAAAYVEPIVENLVDAELMKRMGDGRVYSDFLIYHVSDCVKYIKEQEGFVEEHGNEYHKTIRNAIESLKKKEFYSSQLERFMLIRIAEEGLSAAKDALLGAQHFPDRPKGGKWVAFGIIYPENYTVPEDMRGKEEYGYSGRRVQSIAGYLGEQYLELHNYETALYGYGKYDGFDRSILDLDQNMLKLFYLTKHHIDPRTVDLDSRILEDIPLLEEKGFLCTHNGKLQVAVPCLTHEQHDRFIAIVREAAEEFSSNIKGPLGEYFRTHKKQLPAHLTGVPAQKLTMPYEPNALMFVFEAISKGLHPRNLGCKCPETIAVFD